jgi:hypothetical protein
VWFNTVLVLTHAGAAPPDSNNGPLNYDTYTNHRMHLLQQSIRWAGAWRLSQRPMLSRRCPKP